MSIIGGEINRIATRALNMRVLVTGAAGFLGKQLCAELVNAGAKTRALVRRPSDALATVGAELHLGDVTDQRAIASAMDGVDAIVHLAARVHVMRDTVPDPLAEFRRVNVEGTRLLTGAAKAAGVKHLVFASSVKAVGSVSTESWNSGTTAQPTDAYGISKLEAERLLLSAAVNHPPSITIIRFPLMYGPGMKGNMLRLFRTVDRGWPVPVGTRENARSILFVGNATAAIIRVLQRAIEEPSIAAPPGPFFVADGRGQSTESLVKDIARSLGRRGRVVRLPQDVLRAAGRVEPFTHGRFSGIIDRLFGSLDVDQREFESEYNFQPPYTRQQGMDITARWFQQP